MIFIYLSKNITNNEFTKRTRIILVMLVNSIRNLEIYYRNFVRNPKYIEKRRESLKADQELLLECVERKVSEKNKKHFTQNILYVGEKFLCVKLNELIVNLPEALFAACIQREDRSPSKSRTSLINKLTVENELIKLCVHSSPNVFKCQKIYLFILLR